MSVKNTGFPKNGKTAPNQAEGQYESVRDIQAQSLARLTAPQQLFAGTQFTLDFCLGLEINRVHRYLNRLNSLADKGCRAFLWGSIQRRCKHEALNTAVEDRLTLAFFHRKLIN